ncbi:MAG: hypothetical protein ACYC6G_01980 [Desulfobaccales bacterium]
MPWPNQYRPGLGSSNLISNAISFTPAGSKVVAVSAAMEGGYLRWWSIILATLGFAMIPFCSSIDLFLNERIAQLFILAHTPKPWYNYRIKII